MWSPSSAIPIYFWNLLAQPCPQFSIPRELLAVLTGTSTGKYSVTSKPQALVCLRFHAENCWWFSLQFLVCLFGINPQSPLIDVSVYVFNCSVIFDSLWPPGLLTSRLLCPWDFPSKNIGVGNHSLLQGIFWTQEWNPHLQHCGHSLYYLSQQGSPVDVFWFNFPLVLWLFIVSQFHFLHYCWFLLKWTWGKD